MKRTSLVGILLVCMAVSAAHAETLNVPGDAYPTIQRAIDASQDGDVVVVGPGIYFERIDFRGKDITVTSTDPNDPRVVGYTVLNGEREGTVVTFANGETAQAVLAGFTITGGYGTLNPELSGGGQRLFMGAGIYCDGSSPTITKNVIVRNEGPLEISPDFSQVDFCYGGGIGAWNANPTITYNTIRNNVAFVGAGIIGYFGELTVHNNLIYENSASLGGGLVAFSGNIYSNTIVRNDCDQVAEAPELGGGQGGNVYMVFLREFGSSRLVNNVIAEAPSGGGLYWEGDVSVAFVAFNNVWGNTSGDYGYLDSDTGASAFGGEADQTGIRGNISEDPLFLASMSRNFHLTLDSPCINAGDPDYVAPTGQTDIDGEDRIYASRIDMGADEYVGYVKPVAFAGGGVHVLDVGDVVMLDGRESFFYDPGDIQIYRWSQVSGPEVVLDASDVATPTFSPPEPGEYVFELVVGDSQYESEPDQVLVFVGLNVRPVANAGPDRVWQAPGEVALDGTGSYDPDPVDRLSYAWTQLEGPAVTLENAETATPTFAAEPGGIYVFELLVSDGFEDSEPSRVRLVTVGGTTDIRMLSIEPIEGRYPHYLDISGTKVVFASDSGSGPSWPIAYRDFRTNETESFSGGGLNTQPKIEGDLVVWTGDIRFRNNVLGPECASVLARNLTTGDELTLRAKSDRQSFSHPAISGNKVVWVQHLNIDRNVADQWHNMPYDIGGADITDPNNPAYFTIATNVGRRDPIPYGNVLEDYDDVVDIEGNVVVWEGNGDIYAADISDLDAIRVFTVCDEEGRQYDPAVSGQYVVWTDERNDEGDIYGADISDPEHVSVFEIVKDEGAQRQPAVEGCMVAYIRGEALGWIGLACITRNSGVLALDLSGAGYGLAPAFDGTSLVWLADTYGPVQGMRLAFGYSISDGVIENVTTGERYDYLQHAISDADAGSEIVVPQGVYREEIDFVGKAVTVRSANPGDPAVVAATVLQGDGNIVTFAEGEAADAVLDGLTITGGSRGMLLSEASPTIRRCTITANRGAGMVRVNTCKPELNQCRIVGNQGDGIEMWAPSERRTVRYSKPTLQNCVVAGNHGAGIQGGQAVVNNCTIVENGREGILCLGPTVTNSIIYFNDPDGAGAQVGDSKAAVTYSNIQGGWSGAGNMDADPAFLQLGQWDADGWIPGDYHLQSQGYRWDGLAGLWTSDEATSPCIDAGDPASPVLDEPVQLPGAAPVTNERINMGAYGGTAEASLAAADN